jgi:hypothetical protein
MKTPGVFIPDAFKNLDDFKETVNKAGLEQGWTPIEDPSTDKNIIQQGEIFVDNILVHFGKMETHWGIRSDKKK